MDLISLCERGLIPDQLSRFGMRQLISRRLTDEAARDGELRSARFNQFLQELRASPIAIETPAANDQHYEVPAEFFHLHLGPRLKYSCCLYPDGGESLAEAEEKMLQLYRERLGVADGMKVLDLGCGWGSVSLWLAEQLPNAQIVGLSNSNGQREFIEARARDCGLQNLQILTGDIAEYQMPDEVLEQGFDRVISIEMFEHMKNYAALLNKISGWMKPEARLFVHIFVHKLLAYHFEDKNRDDWMTRYFFSGGTMPSENLLLNFQDDLKVAKQWWVSGKHYEKTSNHWLENLDSRRERIERALKPCYGEQTQVWIQRWRMFYMAVAELFGMDGGNQWGVGHYLFVKR